MIFDYTPGNLLVVELDKRKTFKQDILRLLECRRDKTLDTNSIWIVKGNQVESMTDREIGTNSRPDNYC